MFIVNNSIFIRDIFLNFPIKFVVNFGTKLYLHTVVLSRIFKKEIKLSKIVSFEAFTLKI